MNRFTALACSLSFICLAGPAAAAVDVDLALVLAVDVSRSMDDNEQKLQRGGYVAAFRHPDVIQAIRTGIVGRIAVTYMEWSDVLYQRVLVPWTFISNRSEAEAFAALLEQAPIAHQSTTSISSGLEAASRLFATSDTRAIRRVINVSGDGPNNEGPPVAPMRDSVVAQGIVINGLPIIVKTGSIYSLLNIPNLDIYYRDCVIGGPGAFMVTIDNAIGFEEAIRRKLVLEISILMPRLIPAAEVARPAPEVDCLIGEKKRQQWMIPLTK